MYNTAYLQIILLITPKRKLSVFKDLKPSLLNKPRSSKPKSLFGELYENAMETTVELGYGRLPEFRPSSFPVCPILVATRLQEATSYGASSSLSCSGGYFTSVGHAAHDNIQYFMGVSGKIWGDWKCKAPICKLASNDSTTTAENTTVNTCPECGHPMKYVEKTVVLNGLTGHIDCIVMTKAGVIIGDYKTSSKSAIDSGKLPKKAHLHQVPTYALAFEQQYKMIVLGFALLYLSRDNPFKFYEHYEDWSDKWRDYAQRNFNKQRKRFRLGVKAFRKQDIAIAVRKKPCKDRDYYEEHMDFYESCPMLGVCFKPNKLEKVLSSYIKDRPVSTKRINEVLKKIPVELL